MINRPNLDRYQCAYFQEYSDGSRILKFKYKHFSDWNVVIIQSDGTYQRLYHHSDQEMIDFCLSLGFENDTYPFDNRTETQLKQSYDQMARVCATNAIPCPSYPEWKARLKLTF